MSVLLSVGSFRRASGAVWPEQSLNTLGGGATTQNALSWSHFWSEMMNMLAGRVPISAGGRNCGYLTPC